MERAVDCDNITLSQHLLQISNTSATNLRLNLWLKWLIIEVQQLLAVEWLQTSQDTLTNSSNSNSTNDLTLKIELVLGSGSNVPFSGLDLFMCGHEVTDENQDGHDDVLSDRYDVGSGNLCDGDTTIGLVGSIEIDVVRSNTGCDGNLEVLGLGETFGSEVTWVETGKESLLASANLYIE